MYVNAPETVAKKLKYLRRMVRHVILSTNLHFGVNYIYTHTHTFYGHLRRDWDHSGTQRWLIVKCRCHKLLTVQNTLYLGYMNLPFNE